MAISAVLPLEVAHPASRSYQRTNRAMLLSNDDSINFRVFFSGWCDMVAPLFRELSLLNLSWT